MKNVLFIFILLFFFGKVNGKTISGVILNGSSEEPIANVTIKVKATSETVLSATDGSFSIEVDKFPVELQVTAPGFLSKAQVIEEPVDHQIIYLFPKMKRLSEVLIKSSIIPSTTGQTPASVAVLERNDLKSFGQANLMKSIGSVAGVYVHQGALNTNKLSIRGVGARSQYSTNRVKAYFEGIPITSAEGITTLDDIPPEIIGRIEIIKGPNSSLYGAGMGGDINLYAVNPHKLGTGGKIKSTAGSFGLRKNSAQVSYASENTGIVAAYNRVQSDGFRENGAYNRQSFTLYGKTNGKDTLNELSFLANFVRLKAYIPSSLNKEQLEAHPSSAASSWAASKAYESYDKGLFGFTYRHYFSNDFYNVSSVYMNFRDGYEPRPFDILKEEQIGVGAKTKFIFGTNLFTLPSKFSVGGEYFRESYDITTFENLYEDFPNQGSVAGNSLSNNSQNRSYANLFAQWNLSFSDKFKIETGLNINTTQYHLTDLFARDSIDQSGNYRFETVLSPRLGLLYNLTQNKTLYASISHGFSTPTVEETLTPEGLINTNLQPETGINYEVGFKGRWFDHSLYSEISLYSIQINHLIVAERVAEDQYVGRNLGKTNHNGIEILLNYNFQVNPNIAVKPHLNAAFNFYKFEEFTDNGENFSGNELPGIPDNTISAGLDITSRSGAALYLKYKHVGEMALNDANSLYNGRYDLVDVKASYSLVFLKNWEMEIFAGINNIFDESYAASIVTNAVGFGGSTPRYYYPGKPRNLFGRIGVGYNF